MKNNYDYIRIKNTFMFTLIMILVIILLVLILNVKQNRIKKNILFNVPQFYVDDSSVDYSCNIIDNLSIDPTIKIYITKKNKIVEMNLEEYIKGVVAAEMPVGFDMEALKAQAIAARTYALAHMENAGGSKYPNAKGATLDDTVSCQVYINKNDRMKTWPKNKENEYWSKICEAVNDTYGMILTFNNEIVKEPFYFSTSSGKTEFASEVFKVDVPYLKSVESPGEEIAPKYESAFKFTYDSALKMIERKFNNSGITKKNIKDKIRILKRTEGGSVKEIKIGNSTISGFEFRQIFGLTSANFEMNFASDYLNIICKGYGHGVGMSQWGANVMGKNGDSYIKILKHYYQGVEIKQINYTE